MCSLLTTGLSPELVLYKVCRYYFQLLLPFSSSFHSDLVDLSNAQPLPVDNPDALTMRSASMDFGDAHFLPDNLLPSDMQRRWGLHPVEIAVIPFPNMRDKILLILEALQATNTFHEHPVRIPPPFARSGSDHEGSAGSSPPGASPSKSPSRQFVYEFGFNSKPHGGRWLPPAARDWLGTFFVDFVQALRIWCLADDVFDISCLEVRKESCRLCHADTH